MGKPEGKHQKYALFNDGTTFFSRQTLLIYGGLKITLRRRQLDNGRVLTYRFCALLKIYDYCSPINTSSPCELEGKKIPFAVLYHTSLLYN